MGDIVNIEANLPHCVAEVICVKCGKRWIGVWPEEVYLKDLVCENCGPGFVIMTGQEFDWEESH